MFLYAAHRPQDTGTSPRPDADNVLLEERDRAITTQAERIKLLTEAHGKVYGEVDSLEAEITKLQQRLVDKEGEAMKYKVRNEQLRRRPLLTLRVRMLG